MKRKRVELEQEPAQLRAAAQAQLARGPAPGARGRTADELLHELQVHQVELQMQNEALRRANAQLEEARDHYFELYEFAPVGYVTLDAEQRIREVSLNGAVLLGDERTYLLHAPFETFVAAADAARWRQMFQNVLRYGGRQNYELSLERRDGYRFEARLNCLRVETDGEPPGVRVALTDISEVSDLKRVISDTQVAAIVFESQQGMMITDADGIILRVNRAFAEIAGYAEHEAVGRNARFLKSGRHDDAFYRSMWRRIGRQGSWQGEVWNRRKSGEIFPALVNITAVKSDDGSVTHYVGTMLDITQRKQAEAEIENLAFFDPLTHLPNRRLFLERLRQALITSQRIQRGGALLLIDLDDFRTLNDTLGHHIDDRLLAQVADRLGSCIDEGDAVARVGGDEFAIILEDLRNVPQEAAGEAERVGERILATLNQTHLVEHHELHASASIGITLFTEQQCTVEELMKRADVAMYHAKAAGRNTLRFFDPGLQESVLARAALERSLRAALARKEFVLYFQPQVDADGELFGSEALVRWQSPRRGLVHPQDFIPVAEQSGMILALGMWVLEKACQQLVSWNEDEKAGRLSIAVNVSARQFRQPQFVEQVLAVLEHSGANPRKLKLELTESVLLDDVDDAIAKMNRLRSRGVSFSLDDFGTGYSSLSYLKHLPLDQLKIDRSFIRNLLTDPHDTAIATTVVALAQSMNLKVVAEGVETEAQRDFLADHGCPYYQGFLFSPPLPQEAFERLLH